MNFVSDNLHILLLFSRRLLASILDKSRSKQDLFFDGVVIFIHCKMINLDSITNENNKEHNEKCRYTLDHPYRIIIIGGSGSGKTNTLINLINEQHDIEPKYEYLFKKRENIGIKHLNDPKTFIECSNMMDDVYKYINDYNTIRKRKKKYLSLVT